MKLRIQRQYKATRLCSCGNKLVDHLELVNNKCFTCAISDMRLEGGILI